MSLTGAIPSGFQKLFASWLRLEPRCRSDDFSRGLEARTADPLWMLTRQWQLGEFQAEDAGSPIRVDLSYQTGTIEEVTLGRSSAPVALRRGPPLEALVERESTRRDDWRVRVQIGQQFERLLRARFPDQAQALIDGYRQQPQYAIKDPDDAELVELDQATQRFRRLMAGRAIDGHKLMTDIEARTPIPLPTGVSADVTETEMVRVTDDLRTWYQRLYSQPEPDKGSAWRPEKLDYSFEVQTPAGAENQIRLVAPDYRNGELDWYTFSVSQPAEGRWPEPQTKHFPPTRVSFAGMPHPRWWAFEDSRTDFGNLDVATPDLAKLMLMQFALVYGDDWFILPLELPMGGVAKVTSLQVTDVFGVHTYVERGRTDGDDPLKRFRLFELSLAADPGGPGMGEFLFVPPVVGFREESPPIEEVRFQRDEVANMAWAIEHTVPNKLGEPVAGLDAWHERERELLPRVLAALGTVINPRTNADIVSSEMVRDLRLTGSRTVAFSLVLKPGDPPDLVDKAKQSAESVVGVKLAEVVVDTGESQLPLYRLATTVPPMRIPLLPAAVGGSIKLERAQMPQEEGDGYEAMTRLLTRDEPGAVKWMDEEVVPRAGVKVLLTRQRVRWVDGETYVWLGRKVVTGSGEGSSGPRFDVLAQSRKGIAGGER